jgi:hyperosmotically inducible protein
MKKFAISTVFAISAMSLASSPALSQDAAATMPSKAANTTLSKNVRRSLDKEPGLHASNIRVRSRGGAVTLEGTVPTTEEIPIASDATSKVPGVSSVANALSVKAEGR